MTVDELAVKIHRLQAQNQGRAEIGLSIGNVHASLRDVGSFSDTAKQTIVLVGTTPE